MARLTVILVMITVVLIGLNIGRYLDSVGRLPSFGGIHTTLTATADVDDIHTGETS